MEFASLSDIFDDPTLNEFTDNLLNDFDIAEFSEYAPDSTHHSSEACDVPIKAEPDVEAIWDQSSHTTLEALLKSHLPSSCVPPAPDLQSHLRSIGDKKFSSRHLRVPVSNHCRRSSLPIIKREPSSLTEATKANQTESTRKSKLICNYLKKHTTEEFDTQSQKPVYPDSVDGPSQSKGTRRAPHNAIEKRYRASINGRIDELRKILIPDPDCDAKLNKSAVLRQAIDHIRDLEKENEMLRAEVEALRALQRNSLSKSSHSSPESGISSFEPSPSSSTLASMEFGHLTPSSSGASCGSLFQTAMGSANGAVPCDGTDISTETLDTCPAPWSFYSGLYQQPHLLDSVAAPAVMIHDNLEADILTKPVYSLLNDPDTNHSTFVFGEQLIPGSTEYVLTDSRPCLTSAPTDSSKFCWSGSGIASNANGGTRYKRSSNDVNRQPIKVRREEVPSGQPTIDQKHGGNSLRHAQLLVQNSPSSCLSTASSSDSFPNFRHLLSSKLVRTTGSSNFNFQDSSHCVHVSASGFNSVAARTSLCVSALCLMALNPAGFTQSGDSRSSSASGLPSSRHLLSAVASLTFVSSPSWLALLLYALQWIVALCLCLWACRKSPGSSSYSPVDSCSPGTLKKSAITHWEKAMDAINRASWSLANRRLRLYLCTVGAPISCHPVATSMNLADTLSCRFRRFSSWVTLAMKTVYFVLINFLPLTRLTSSQHKATGLSSVPVLLVDDDVTPSPAAARLFLLEVHTLACLTGRGKENTSVTDTLSVAQLILACAWDFVDALLQYMSRLHPQGNSAEFLPPDLTLKEGFVLILAIKDMGAPKWMERLIMKWIVCLTGSLTGTNIWSSFAINPVLNTLVVELSRDKLLRCSECFPSASDIAQILRVTLLQSVMDHSLHKLVHSDGPELKNLDPYISSLLQLSHYDEQNMATSPSVSNVFYADVGRTEWWARFMRIAWLHRLRDSEAHFAGARAMIHRPSRGVVDCLHTGHLAESIWLYSSLSEDGGFSGSNDPSNYVQRAANLLHMHFMHISGHWKIDITESSPTELGAQSTLLLTILAASWLLALAAKSLRPSSQLTKSNDASRTNALSMFNTAFCVLQESSSSLTMAKPGWVSNQLSCALALRRVIHGVNPVRSRMALLHAWRALPKLDDSNSMVEKSKMTETTQNPPVLKAPLDETDSSDLDTPHPAGHTFPDEQLSSLQKQYAQSMKPSRIAMITQSPGQ